MVDINGYDVPEWAGGYAGSDEPTLTPTPYEAPTLSDHLNNFHAAISALRSDSWYTSAQHETDPEWQKYYDAKGKYHNDMGKYYLDQLSPAAQKNSQAGFLSGDWRAHPFSSTAFAIEGMLPSAAVAGVAAVGAGMVGGPPAGYAAGAAAWGKQAAESAAGGARNYIINEAPLSELMKDPNFASRSKVMSEEDNRRIYATEQIDNTHLEAKTFAAGTTAAAAAELIPGLTPEAGGLISRMVAPAVGGAAMGVIQTPITDLALGQVTPGLQKTPEEIESETLRTAGGFAALGAIGGAGGIFEHFRRRSEGRQTENRGSLSPEAQPGVSGTSVGSPTGRDIDRKPIEEPGKAAAADQWPSTPPPPAPGIVSDEQKAATDAAQKPSQPPPSPPPPISSVPESEDTLKLQEQALRDGKKEIVIYPQGKGYSYSRTRDISDQTGMGVTKFTNGDVAIFDRNGPNNLTYVKIRDLHNRGKLNEITGHGPVSQEEAMSRAAQGEEPKAVVERTPDDTEVKTAAATDQTAAGAADVMEQTKADNRNTVNVEDPTKVIQDRLAAQREKMPHEVPSDPEYIRQVREAEARLAELEAAHEKLAPVAEPTPSPPVAAPTPRVLRPIGEEKTGWAPAPGITERVETPAAPGKKGEEYVKNRAENNKIAQDIITKHPLNTDEVIEAMEGARGSRIKLLNKLRTMIADAKNNNFIMPTRIRDSATAPERNHSIPSIILMEANRLVNKYSKEGSPALQRFATHLDMALKGDREGLLRTRLTEAKETLAQPDIGKKELVTAPSPPDVAAFVPAAAKEKAELEAKLEQRRAESEELKKAAQEKAQETKKEVVVEKVKKRKIITPEVTKGEEIRLKQQERAAKFEQKGEPTPAQLEAGNYDKVHTRFEGEPISIETGKGEIRKPWKEKLKAAYGYIKGTVGKDGSQIDAFIGPHGETGKIWIFNQLNDKGQFDEHKVMLGFNNVEQAINAYGKDRWRKIGGIVGLSHEEFKNWLEHGDHSQPIKEGLEGEDPEQKVTTTDYRNKTIDIDYAARTSINDSLNNIDINHFPVFMRAGVKILIDRINNLVGDLPVYWISPDEMRRTDHPYDLGISNGVYEPQFNHILLNLNILSNSKKISNVILHEAFHAATIHGWNNIPKLKELGERLYHEVMVHIDREYPKGNNIPDEIRYAMESPVEMLTEMSSNPVLHDILKKGRMSDDLAQQLDMPNWRRATLFQGALDWFKNLFGLNNRQYGLLEGMFNIGEQLMHPKDTTEEASYQRRTAILLPDRSQENMMEEGGRYYSRSIDKGNRQVQDRINKLMTTTAPAAGHGAMIWLKKTFNSPREWATGKLAVDHPVFGKAAREWVEHMEEQGVDVNKILKEISVPIMNRMTSIYTKQPEEYDKLVSLMVSSRINGAHPDYELGEGLNKHIRITDKDGNLLKPEDISMEHIDAIQGHPGDKEKFNNLKPETQKLYQDVRDSMAEIRKSDLQSARDSIVNDVLKEVKTQDLPLAHLKAIYKVIKGEKLTKEEGIYADDPNIEHIQSYDQMIKKGSQGPYFPLTRDGTHAVIGSYDYNIPAGAMRDPDDPNRIIFKSREDAYNFNPHADKTRATNKDEVKLPTHRETRTVVTDEKGKRRYVPSDEAAVEGQPQPQQEWHVIVEPRHVELANGFREGEDKRNAMMANGVNPDTISQVAERKDVPLQVYGMNAQLVKALTDRTDKMPHLTEGERSRTKDAIEHVALSLLPGNKLSKNLLTASRVAGAGDDMIRALDVRYRASANFQAMAKHRAAIDEALKQIDDYSKSMRTHEDYAELQAASNMFRDRTINFKQDQLSNINMSKTWSRVGAWASIRYLVSPAFLAYHQLHIPLVVLPRLANEIGWFPAFRTLLGVYRQMLGGAFRTIGKGISSGWHGAWDYDHEPINFVDALKKELIKNGGTTDELKALEWGADHDLLHNTGIDFSEAYKGLSLADRIEKRSRNISQEVIGSADAVNRFNSFLAFYRAAKSKGLEGIDAYRWAGDRVAETQGQFSAFNRVSMFRDPRMRAVLQFKSFPLILMKTITKALYNSLRKGATGEERWQAVRTLGGLMSSAFVLSGVSGAVPEPVEDIVNIMAALGLTKTWHEYEDKLRMAGAKELGAEGATLLMDGLGGAVGLDIHHRGGISDLTGLARIQTTRPQDIEQSWFKVLAGIPGSIMGDGLNGINQMKQGNITAALELLLPKVMVDPIKAYQMYNQGVTTQAGKTLTQPVGIPDALRRALGFTTETESHAREARYITGIERQEQQTQHQKIINMYQSGDHVGALEAMRAYNATHPPRPMTVQQILSTIKAKGKPTVLGYPDTPRNRAELEQRARAYGLQ